MTPCQPIDVFPANREYCTTVSGNETLLDRERPEAFCLQNYQLSQARQSLVELPLLLLDHLFDLTLRHPHHSSVCDLILSIRYFIHSQSDLVEHNLLSRHFPS